MFSITYVIVQQAIPACLSTSTIVPRGKVKGDNRPDAALLSQHAAGRPTSRSRRSMVQPRQLTHLLSADTATRRRNRLNKKRRRVGSRSSIVRTQPMARRATIPAHCRRAAGRPASTGGPIR